MITDCQSKAVRRVRLSWHGDAATTMTITCEAPPDLVPTVSYARDEAVDRLDGAASEVGRRIQNKPGTATAGSVSMKPFARLTESTTVWAATLRGLTPDTMYCYTVSCEDAPAAELDRRFHTGPDSTGRVRAGWLADTGLIGRLDGNASGTERIYRALTDADCTVILGGGDYAYANRDGRFGRVSDAIDEWLRQAEPLISSVPFMPQYGNHEIYLEERYEDWASRFVLPGEKCYAFSLGSVRFVAFFAPGKNPDDEHIRWLESELSSPDRRRCRWCVVYHHEAIYGHGYSHPTNLNIRHLLAPVYEGAGVDLVINAHDQNYERTFPLVSIPHDPRRGSDHVSRYSQGDGVVFLKSSPGGKKSEIGNRFSPFPAGQDRVVAVRDASGHHFSVIDTDPECLEVRSYLVPEEGQVSELDVFSIRSPNGAIDG